MEVYLKSLGTIILLYTSICNLNFFEIKLKEVILMIVLAESICCVMLLGGNGEFLILLPIIILPMIFLYRKSKNIVKSISLPIFSLLITVVTTYLLADICFNVLKLDFDLFNSSIELYWVLLAFEFIMVIIVSKLVALVIYKRTGMSNLNLKGKLGFLILLSLILTVAIFYSNILLDRSNNSKTDLMKINGILFLLYFVLLMVIMYILIRSITKEVDFKNKQDQFENLQQYTNNLEVLYSDMRAFRHDYINILSSMVGYIQNEDMKGLSNHFNDKILPLSSGMEESNFKIGVLKNIKIPEIKGTFSSKLIRAQEMGIDVHIEITEPLEQLNIDIIDICRSIGILIDNAIEAAIKCDKPTIKVAIINDEKNVKIIIINSCTVDTPPIFKIFQKGFSTKGNSRGIGLYNLKETIGKYSHITLDTIIEDGEFKQILQINKG